MVRADAYTDTDTDALEGGPLPEHRTASYTEVVLGARSLPATLPTETQRSTLTNGALPNVSSPTEKIEVRRSGVWSSGGSVSPLASAGMFSRWTFRWLTPFVRHLHRHRLTEPALPKHVAGDAPHELIPEFCQFWDARVAAETTGGPRTSVWTCLLAFHKWYLIYSCFILFVCSLAWVATPAIWINLIIQYIESGDDDDLRVGLPLVVGMVLTDALRSLTIQQYWFRGQMLAGRARTLVFGLTYYKAMQLTSTAGYTIGELMTMCSNDAERVFEACRLLCIPFLAVVELTAVFILSVLILGPAAIIGFVIVLLLLPFKLYFARVIGKLRKQLLKETDDRVRTLSEVVVAIKLIKMYAWEAAFTRKVMETRHREAILIFKISFIQSMLTSLMFVLPTLASVVSFIVHIESGNDLKASQAYSLIAIYNILYMPLSVTPTLMRQLVEVRSGMSRLTTLMRTKSHQASMKTPPGTRAVLTVEGEDFAWPLYDLDPNSNCDHDRIGARRGSRVATGNVVRNLELTVQDGELIGICGAVGSGKTAIITALLGQMRCTSNPNGGVAIRGQVAYVSQQAWIQSTTVRENILFGAEYDPTWYHEVVTACCLTTDFELLQSGDLTVVGERGINLSGGQKQRISIARAVYANREIVILDDPLSAVDVHVSQRLFSDVILGVLRRSGTTVILATHNVRYLSECTRVLFMNNGEPIGPTPHNEMVTTSPLYQKFVSQPTQDSISTIGDDVTSGMAVPPSSKSQHNTLSGPAKTVARAEVTSPTPTIVGEEYSSGGVNWASLHVFLRGMGGFGVAVALMLLFPVTMGVRNFTDWWVGFWISQGDGTHKDGNIGDNPDKDFYLGVYGGSALAFCCLICLKGMVYVGRMLAGSSSLHAQLISHILRAPMSFFDVTESGEISARFSRDVDEIDTRLIYLCDQLGAYGCVIALAVITIAIIFPPFAAVLLVLFLTFVWLVSYFRNVQNQLKSLDNRTAAPLFSHFSASIQGLSTIHAFGKAQHFQQTYFDILDVNSRATSFFYNSSVWFAYRLDFLSLAMLLVTGLCCIFLDIDPARAGLALAMANSIVGLFQFTIRLQTEVVARFNSVDRIAKYIRDVPSEPEADSPIDPPASWPTTGEIQFDNVTLRYRDGLPDVIKNLTLSIGAGENIGIVGRTGSGKSSIALSLFRLLAAHGGHITIDGVDISTLSLNTLRKNLAIVPQDPQIFEGTVRSNLDPFSEVADDAELWQALRDSHLHEIVAELPDQLDAVVEENGGNFSVGERQLLCLARVLLKNPRILILDEATSSIDSRTDRLIQETIRTAFFECTVLMVAHRLETILDCDKVLVLNAGRKVEFNSPSALESDSSSEFYAMLQAHRRGSNIGLGRPNLPTVANAPSPLPQRREHSFI